MPRKSQPKKPYVSVRLTPSLKNVPQGFIGSTSSTLLVGVNADAELWHLLVGSCQAIADFYVQGVTISRDDFQAQVKKAASFLVNLDLLEEK
jgi:hypothetical protein